ncbi:MAG: septal ring lytic transglycosylase RlpA family protein [Bacteroidota bacterium]
MKFFSFVCFLAISFTLTAQEYGRVSYYADSFQGLKTASGELYDKNKMTASHNTLPFGTMIRVTRLDNKKSVVVKVNDRGPFIKGRIVDVSRKAAEQLDLIIAGEAQVKVEVVGKGAAAESVAVANRTTATPRGGTTPTPSKATTTTKRPAVYNDSSVPTRVKEKTVPTALPKGEMTKKGASAKEEKMQIGEAKVLRGNFNSYGLYKIQLMRPDKKGYGVQVASYSSYDNVMKQIADLQAKWFEDILVNIEPGKDGQTSYKIILGQFDNQKAAEVYKSNLKKKHRISGFVVNITEM